MDLAAVAVSVTTRLCRSLLTNDSWITKLLDLIYNKSFQYPLDTRCGLICRLRLNSMAWSGQQLSRNQGEPCPWCAVIGFAAPKLRFGSQMNPTWATLTLFAVSPRNPNWGNVLDEFINFFRTIFLIYKTAVIVSKTFFFVYLPFFLNFKLNKKYFFDMQKYRPNHSPHPDAPHVCVPLSWNCGAVFVAYVML